MKLDLVEMTQSLDGETATIHVPRSAVMHHVQSGWTEVEQSHASPAKPVVKPATAKPTEDGA